MNSKFRPLPQAQRCRPLPQYQSCRQQGFVFIATLMVIPVLLLCGGFAASVSQALASKTQLANSAETTALFLSLRGNDSNGKNTNAAQDIISQFSGLSKITNADITIKILQGGYQVSAKLDTPMYLLNTQQQSIKMAVNAVIKAENEVSAQKVELSLVLDYSSSMAGKEPTMGATLAQISQLFSKKNGKYLNMKLAAAPFSSGVSTRYQGMVDVNCYQKTNTDWADLALDWPSLLDDIDPTTEEFDDRCYYTPKVERLILTDDVIDIDNLIEQASTNYSANGGTEIDQGLLWGLRLLNPAWQEYQGEDAPAPFDNSPYPETKKILFLMTDAAAPNNWCQLVNTSFNYCNSPIPLCEYAKELGVRIVTMYFDTGGGDSYMAQQNLQACSSGGPDDHYLATNSDEVIEQFKKILDGIYSNQLRLVK